MAKRKNAKHLAERIRKNNIDPKNTVSKILNVPYFSQNDPAWSNLLMQNQNLPIGSAGCTLTSFAMILNYLTGSGNPKDVNTRMGIYACYNGSPRGFGFAKAAEYYNLSIIYSNTSIVDSDFVTSQVVQYISQGYPLLVGLENTQGNTHYVTVTGYSRSESNFIYTIKINDPGYSRSVLSEYFDLGYQVYRIYVYKKN